MSILGNNNDLTYILSSGTYSGLGVIHTDQLDINLTLGGNTFTPGNGDFTIYGSLRDLSLTLNGGTALSGATVNTIMDGTIDLTGGGVGNTITAGNGVKTVYGDMRDLTLTVGGATAISDPTFETSPNTTAIAQIQDLDVTVGNNTINLGNGNNTVYGDMQSLNLVSPASTAIGFNSNIYSGIGDLYSLEQLFFFGIVVEPHFDNFNFHTNTITVGNGVNTIYGHLQTLNFSSVGGTASSPGTMPNPGSPYVDSTLPFYEGYLSGANEIAGIYYTNITMDAAIITAGSGTNTIYGDFQTLQGNIVTGTNTGTFAPPFNGMNSADGVFPFQSNDWTANAFTMAGNTIKAGLSGGGVNTIYGTMQDWISNVNGGVNDQGASQIAAISFSLFVMGGTGTLDPLSLSSVDVSITGNTIATGNGVNTIYGDMRDFTFNLNGGIEDGHNEVSFALPHGGEHNHFLELYMGYNTITTGNGVNTIFGSMDDLTWTINGGQGINIDPASTDFLQAFISNNFISMGHDTIVTGTGTNTIHGDFHNLNLTTSGGSNTSTPFVALSGAVIAGNTFLGGYNTITAGMIGSSVNVIYGEGNDINFSVIGGTASGGLVAQDTIRSNNLFIGNNTITTGNGTSTVYGDIHALNWSAKAGSADGLGSNADAFLRSHTVEMGGNTIHVGTGANTIYGDAQSFSFSVKGGSVTNGGILNTYGVDNLTDASAHMINNTITMVDNHLYGGAGNDILYGNVRDLIFSAIDGNVVSGTGDASASFAGGYHLTNGAAVVDVGNHITFGSDTLFGGAGNDFFSGDAVNLTGLDKFLTGLNTITWGNDILTGGTGADKFGFTLLDQDGFVAQGQDIITDLKTSEGDRMVLKVETGVTLSDVNMETVFTHSAEGGGAALDTVATFHDGSSITLWDVNIASFSAANTVLVH